MLASPLLQYSSFRFEVSMPLSCSGLSAAMFLAPRFYLVF